MWIRLDRLRKLTRSAWCLAALDLGYCIRKATVTLRLTKATNDRLTRNCIHRARIIIHCSLMTSKNKVTNTRNLTEISLTQVNFEQHSRNTIIHSPIRIIMGIYHKTKTRGRNSSDKQASTGSRRTSRSRICQPHKSFPSNRSQPSNPLLLVYFKTKAPTLLLIQSLTRSSKWWRIQANPCNNMVTRLPTNHKIKTDKCEELERSISHTFRPAAWHRIMDSVMAHRSRNVASRRMAQYYRRNHSYHNNSKLNSKWMPSTIAGTRSLQVNGRYRRMPTTTSLNQIEDAWVLEASLILQLA